MSEAKSAAVQRAEASAEESACEAFPPKEPDHVIRALHLILGAVENLELALQDIIDGNDRRLVNARNEISAAQTHIDHLAKVYHAQ